MIYVTLFGVNMKLRSKCVYGEYICMYVYGN